MPKYIDLNCDMGESYGRYTLGADEDYLCYQTGALREFARVAMASSTYDAACRKRGVRVASEGFADRAYDIDGRLVSRKVAGSLLTDPQQAADQAVRMAVEGKVKTMEGPVVDGDTPGAEKIVRTVREALEKAGCQVKPLREWLPRA
jgi:UPF0271 protein